MDCIPIPWVCFQCGTDQNPCHCNVVGPTIGFGCAVVLAVFCWPAALFCGCCASETGKKMLAAPVDISGRISNSIPI
ncbi:COP9 signalosome complex subunit 1 [Venturia inaequalis]|nr:COP9 signalosome complex subunit 1 [Venturia inaequalis]